MPDPHSKVTLKIPRPLYEKLQQVIADTGYDSVTDFAVSVLRDLAATHEMADMKPYSPEELDRVKERLRGLGYL
jgi:hypothetical protein